MSKLKALTSQAVKTGLIGFLLLAFSGASHAQDSDRITHLEKEVQELKLRLTNLETPQGGSKPVASNEGWKFFANWRLLKKQMSYEEVRAILGEPERIEDRVFTNWFYSNRGSVTFYNDKLEGWYEPHASVSPR